MGSIMDWSGSSLFVYILSYNRPVGVRKQKIENNQSSIDNLLDAAETDGSMQNSC